LARRRRANIDKPSGWKGPSGLGAIAAGVAAIAAVAGVVVALIYGDGGGDEESRSTPLQPSLKQAGPLVVHNPQPEIGANDGLRRTRESLPRVELTIHNQGSGRTIVNGARFSIIDGGLIEDCVGGALGGPLPVSAGYDVILPVPPEAGKTIEVPVSQQVGPDKPDRFVFRFDSPEFRDPFQRTYLFLIRVTLLADRERKVLDMGEALVALPGASSFALRRAIARHGDPECVDRNRRVARRLIRGQPEMAVELSHLLNRF
jgi:hypothetical protein